LAVVRDVVTYGIELAVGIACLAAAAGLRRTGLRWLIALLIAGGIAAAVHALVSF
jgi:hypothetical protein